MAKAKAKRRSGSSPAKKKEAARKRVQKWLLPAGAGAIAGGYLEGKSDNTITLPILGEMQMDEAVGGAALFFGWHSGDDKMAAFGFGMFAAKLHELGYRAGTEGISNMLNDARASIAGQ